MPTRRNPHAGVAHADADPAQSSAGTICSTFTGEPLPGTAKPGRVILALEYPRGWGHDILDGEALGSELASKLTAFLKANKAQLQFIRKPGREGQYRGETFAPTLFISWSEGTSPHASADSADLAEATMDPILEKLHVTGPEDILDLDLTRPGATPGAQRVYHPLLLVCTHGKRDRCCAVRGRPLAHALSSYFEPDHIWESSHTKGHRFAPSMLLLPHNYSYGRMAATGATEVLTRAQQGEMWLQGNRGRGIWDAPGQVAEIVVARNLQAHGRPIPLAGLIVDATVDPALGVASENEDENTTTWRRVSAPSLGQEWAVELQQRSSVMVVSSCGEKPKQSTAWVATTLIEC